MGLEVGCESGSSLNLIRCLRSKGAGELVDAHRRLFQPGYEPVDKPGPSLTWLPLIDGFLVPDTLAHLRPTAPLKPTIIGTNSLEAAFYGAPASHQSMRCDSLSKPEVDPPPALAWARRLEPDGVREGDDALGRLEDIVRTALAARGRPQLQATIIEAYTKGSQDWGALVKAHIDVATLLDGPFAIVARV